MSSNYGSIIFITAILSGTCEVYYCYPFHALSYSFFELFDIIISKNELSVHLYYIYVPNKSINAGYLCEEILALDLKFSDNLVIDALCTVGCTPV